MSRGRIPLTVRHVALGVAELLLLELAVDVFQASKPHSTHLPNGITAVRAGYLPQLIHSV